ncbi:hypothetical protein BDK51DRAFT_46959 [Blyttiomyces helicus]|uniref:Uncharacterized protein n=1 Tax=Blyttiomyces helicus TaxID=388810 RepID=A0A4P9WM61_9FUNG|nr:hypothetical protein BDK51DRAFT_46959 [Blyttiomyces helicus]|eukprot:RKO93103.1 hypothetical protein BDK51DRAFT_46959 [Blyttiomyces helicus]
MTAIPSTPVLHPPPWRHPPGSMGTANSSSWMAHLAYVSKKPPLRVSGVYAKGKAAAGFLHPPLAAFLLQLCFLSALHASFPCQAMPSPSKNKKIAKGASGAGSRKRLAANDSTLWIKSPICAAYFAINRGEYLLGASAYALDSANDEGIDWEEADSEVSLRERLPAFVRVAGEDSEEDETNATQTEGTEYDATWRDQIKDYSIYKPLLSQIWDFST